MSFWDLVKALVVAEMVGGIIAIVAGLIVVRYEAKLRREEVEGGLGG